MDLKSPTNDSTMFGENQMKTTTTSVYEKKILVHDYVYGIHVQRTHVNITSGHG